VQGVPPLGGVKHWWGGVVKAVGGIVDCCLRTEFLLICSPTHSCVMRTMFVFIDVVACTNKHDVTG